MELFHFQQYSRHITEKAGSSSTFGRCLVHISARMQTLLTGILLYAVTMWSIVLFE